MNHQIIHQLKHFFFLFVFSYLTPYHLIAQNPIPPAGEIFKDDVVTRIDIQIAPDSLDILLDPENQQSDYHFSTTMMFDNGMVRDTFEEIGFRLRGNTSRASAKKSIKISFNTYEPGRKYHGLEKLNINGEHNDPSIMRSKLCWDMLRAIGVPASRCNHTELYVNGTYAGLYANVEHIDEEFTNLRFGNNDGNLYKCLFPATLEFLGTSPDLYKEEIFGRRAYELKNNLEEDDYSDLAQFIFILNFTSVDNLPCELEKVFNVDNYLKVIAFDILTSNWDGPVFNKNNFYLYHNQATGQFEYIPFDLDNTFGIDWFIGGLGERDIYNWSPPNEARPIYTQLMAVPLYRHRFSYYMKQMIDDFFNPTHLNPYLDTKKALIDASVVNDPLHGADYGFTFQDYEHSYEQDLGAHVMYGLKPYINERMTSALAQLELENIHPIIKNTTINKPLINEEILVTTEVEDDGGVETVQICYQINDEEQLFCMDMLDDGQNGDAIANDGIYSIQLQGFSEHTDFHYFIEAIDDTNLSLQQPYCGMKTLSIGRNGLELYINEIMASNDETIADEAGEFDDWIEIYNGSNEAIFLGDKYLTDNRNRPDKWKFPDIDIQAGEFLLIWADEDQEQGDLHCNFKLSAGGEEVGLYVENQDGFELIDELVFEPQTTDVAWGRLPNGTGSFQEISATPGASNMPVGLGEIDGILTDIKVFPNPFSKELKIVLQKKIGGNLDFQITNHLGQIVYQDVLVDSVGSSVTFRPKKLPHGTYFLSFYKNGKLLGVKKLVLAYE